MNTYVRSSIQQLLLILTALLHADLINVGHLTACVYQVMVMFHFFYNVANNAVSTQKFDNYAIFASLKSETMGKLINKIPGLRLLISSLPGSASRMHVELLGKHHYSTSIL